jgi:dTDP-4-dehydrorhamnose reductase
VSSAPDLPGSAQGPAGSAQGPAGSAQGPASSTPGFPGSASGRDISALIVGASGQVGHHLALAAERRGLEWTGTFHANPLPTLRSLDVREQAAVRSVVRATSPTHLLVPASATNVDGCEQHPEAAYAVNVQGVDHLVQAANEVGAVVVYFSSDYLFDGEHGPYDERAPANPIQRYGLQKLIAEHLVLREAHESLIVRTTVVYGWEPQGKNFIYRLLSCLREDREIAVPADQIGSPTYAPVLADAVWELLAGGARGIVNVVGRELVGRDEFARKAAQVFGFDPTLVRPIATAELAQPAPRPLRAGLRVELAESLLGGMLLGYNDGLRRMLAERSESREGDGFER